MTGKVQGFMDITRQILIAISEREDCIELTGYDGAQVRHFVHEGIDCAVSRYKWEAARQKKKYEASLCVEKSKEHS